VTSIEQAAPNAGRTPAKRPSGWRRLGSLYLDMLFSSFLGWVLATAFTAKPSWPTFALAFYVIQNFFCRGTFKPTLGDAFLGIRYLASASKQVVADIRVVNPKVKVNGFLLVAGVVEITFALIALSLWTAMDKAVFLGRELNNPGAFFYDTVLGLILFGCASQLLSASQNVKWSIPIAHACILLELVQSASKWFALIPTMEGVLPWSKAAPLNALVPEVVLMAFVLWSVVLMGGVYFSRKILVN
jgi:hypothetical protein